MFGRGAYGSKTPLSIDEASPSLLLIMEGTEDKTELDLGKLLITKFEPVGI